MSNCIEEVQFENALKMMSVKAFDALLTCGVRDLDGLLRLTTEEMNNAAVSEEICKEIKKIQGIIDNNKESEITDRLDITKMGVVTEPSSPTYCEGNNTTPIPSEFIECLSTRARNLLSREQIDTVDRLLELSEEDILRFVGIGHKTVHDIKQLQVKIKFQQNCPQNITTSSTFSNAGNSSSSSRFMSRFISHPEEHCPSDPADWSILSRNLQDLFLWKFPESYDDARAVTTIKELRFSDNELFKLMEYGFSTEDAVDLLFNLSLGYLINIGLCRDSIDKILYVFEDVSGINDLAKSFITSDKVSDTIILYDIDTTLVENLKVDYIFDYQVYELLSSNDVKWSDIGRITEKQIIGKFGFNYQSIKAISSVWESKLSVCKLLDYLSSALPNDAHTSFQNLTEIFVRNIIKKPYHFNVIMGRLGFWDGRRWTLEELGQSLQLSRERVRQIEKQYIQKIKQPKTIGMLNRLWLFVDDALASIGGVSCTSEMVTYLKTAFNWPVRPSDESLASLISISPKYEVAWASPSRIILPGHGCVSCSEIGSMLTKFVADQENGALDFDTAKEKMFEFCKGIKCANIKNIARFSDGYLHYLDDAIEEILADKDTLYTQYAWAQKYGKRRLILFETILKNAGRPMHFTEVHAAANKDRPPHSQFSERSVYGNIERSTELLLWGAGTFIHRELVTIPIETISKIEKDIVFRLNNDTIPYLSVTGIYEQYKELLQQEGIPSAQALYTCLRISPNDTLLCNDYPYILLKSGDRVRPPIQLVLESFILEQEGIVTLEQIKNYALEKLCVSEDVFMASHLPKIPNLLRINQGEYIHLNSLSIDADKLIPIIEHLYELLTRSNHISVLKLYNDKKISCKLLGITTPILLYSLIEYFFSDQFDFSRYPQISLEKRSEYGRRTMGVASEVIQYVLDKNAPCGFGELYQHFVDVLGYTQKNVYNIHFSNQIVRYSASVVVHVESLHWSGEKQEALESIASGHIENLTRSGKFCGLISELFEYSYDRLPCLPEHICWTATLMGELLSRGGKYRILGIARNAYVSIPNGSDIETFDDLVGHIINANYDGAADLDLFVSDMRSAGIIKKSLTSVMLKEDGPVIIDGNVIKLARLR